ncbi:MAG: elongation factor G, partial [Clostridia bacterium]|nr:elongation factor G [Clostridia bacterium]
KGDEDKISTAIARLLDEDPTLVYENNAETKQLTLSGVSDIHLDVVKSKMKNRYGTKVEFVEPKIAYRETIKKSVQAEGKHKKQSGGHGQYGHVKIEFAPGEEEGLTFSESIFGGSVPKNFHPAVEKGLLEAMEKGVLAGFPVVGLKANLYDGSYHDVDSSEMAFKLAAHLAYKEGLKNANPVILEPLGKLTVTAPDYLMGDVIGDLTKRRGKVLGTDQAENKKGYSIIEAEVPKSEMSNYSIQLRAVTQGRATFTYEVQRYGEVPSNIAQKIIDEHKGDVAE